MDPFHFGSAGARPQQPTYFNDIPGHALMSLKTPQDTHVAYTVLQLIITQNYKVKCVQQISEMSARGWMNDAANGN